MVDQSWGKNASAPAHSGANRTIEDRAAERARAREARAVERLGSTQTRLEARAAMREAQVRERERARQTRREAETKLAASDPHAAAAQRHRGSGRKDIVREQRDTTGYTMIVDRDRIRTLAARGASPASLAEVFGLPLGEIEAALVS